ncbi:hypothetical protein mRhiFer1_010096 [Rhinolophus ferrumequinum]|uniref:Uncharacterized protein n=1 Tax=Rhinolophus ferrumequinum TaxID=59479 RepID=A0A7J7XPJ3_RHIFE|nr:hypothetical protein mRhiFer1_010096 [Rhinolophus ferrumequinum]
MFRINRIKFKLLSKACRPLHLWPLHISCPPFLYSTNLSRTYCTPYRARNPDHVFLFLFLFFQILLMLEALAHPAHPYLSSLPGYRQLIFQDFGRMSALPRRPLWPIAPTADPSWDKLENLTGPLEKLLWPSSHTPVSFLHSLLLTIIFPSVL